VREGTAFTRRRLLAGGAVLAGAAAVGVATTGTPFGGGDRTVAYWHLFGGGDGVRMADMLSSFNGSDTGITADPVTLPWGPPYYTKLSLAAVGGRAPDVAVMHATRLAAFAPSGLLEPMPLDLLEKYDIGESQFLPKLWESGQWKGRQFAVPLDTHPWVLYYNTDLLKDTDLLDANGMLKPITGEQQFIDALETSKKITKANGVTFETRGVTPWRMFLTFYSQAGGGPILEDDGKQVSIDDAKALPILEFMGELGKRKLAPDLDYAASVALFSNKQAAFHMNGEWEISTFQAQKMPFNMTTIPDVFGGVQTQADSHVFVIPFSRTRSRERLDAAIEFIAGMVKRSDTWVLGGHVPAYKPVFDSQKYKDLKPQSNYASAANNVVYDPLAWYSGSGSNFETVAGSAFQSVLTGALSPKAGLDTFRRDVELLAETPAPVPV